MRLHIGDFNRLLSKSNISVIYSGPIWSGGIDGIAEMLQRRMEYDDLSMNASQAVFSIFVEQMNNMLMYSAEKETFDNGADAPETSRGADALETSRGLFVLGVNDKQYFIQTGNYVTEYSASILKSRIDHLNTLDKKALRKFFKEQMANPDENAESRGAGLGLIEIARRANSRIDYEIMPMGNGMLYFTMYVEI